MDGRSVLHWHPFECIRQQLCKPPEGGLRRAEPLHTRFVVVKHPLAGSRYRGHKSRRLFNAVNSSRPQGSSSHLSGAEQAYDFALSPPESSPHGCGLIRDTLFHGIGPPIWQFHA
jgi:hypothetical protein